MKKIAVIYWSGTGSTQAMAEAILEGAQGANPEAELFEVSAISADDAAAYDVLVLGCPAMGAEELEDSEFEPFFSELESRLSGKSVALFGSYGWGDGEWMRTWTERVSAAGAQLISSEGLIVCGQPDEDALSSCRKLGQEAAAL